MLVSKPSQHFITPTPKKKTVNIHTKHKEVQERESKDTQMIIIINNNTVVEVRNFILRAHGDSLVAAEEKKGLLEKWGFHSKFAITFFLHQSPPQYQRKA